MDTSSPMAFMDIFSLIIFAYLTICGISGKGQLYKTDSVHKSKREEFLKVMRIFALTIGPIGVLSVVCQMNDWQPWGMILYFVSVAGVLGALVYCYLVGELHMKKKAAKEGKQNDQK